MIFSLEYLDQGSQICGPRTSEIEMKKILRHFANYFDRFSFFKLKFMQPASQFEFETLNNDHFRHNSFPERVKAESFR